VGRELTASKARGNCGHTRNSKTQELALSQTALEADGMWVTMEVGGKNQTKWIPMIRKTE